MAIAIAVIVVARLHASFRNRGTQNDRNPAQSRMQIMAMSAKGMTDKLNVTCNGFHEARIRHAAAVVPGAPPATC